MVHKETNSANRKALLILTILFVFGVVFLRSLSAETLHEAFIQAYTNNPALQAARTQLRVIDERVAEALGRRYPRVQIFSQVGAQWNRNEIITNGFKRSDPFLIGLEVLQPVYLGGQISARIQQSENQVRTQRARLRDVEQTILLQAATTYLNVIRDQAVLELRMNNERVLERQLQATRDRFTVGEITRTDVSQAESRLARVTSARIQAQGQLIASQATYKRVIGREPENLQTPMINVELPTDLNVMIERVIANDPNVIAARYQQAAARNGIDIAEGQLWPQLNLRGAINQSRIDVSNMNDITSAEVTVQLTIPLYSTGTAAAQTRAARQIAHQRNLEVMDALRAAEEQAVQAWYALITTRSIIQSRQIQVQSVQIALDGVRQEERVGSRTLLDILDAEQEVLDAQVELVTVQRDELVAIFTVLEAMGDLDINRLQLDTVPYDAEAYYRQTRERLWGGEIE